MSSLKKEYLCQVTIIEARDLAATDPNGSCDPFIKVRCGNSGVQATTCEESTNSPCWNQSFTFSKLLLTDVELETWELKIDCYDYNAFFANKFIGGFSIGLATLHRNSNHEFYNVWVSLLNSETGSTPQGYLLVNCFIVGPEDLPPTHSKNEKAGLDEDAESSDEEFLDQILTPAQKKERKAKQAQIKVVGAPMVAQKSYQLSVNIYKAESLEGDPSVFVSVRSLGLVERTSVVQNSNNPVWNTKISFPAYKPILNDRITIRLWDYKPRARDKLLGTLPEVPSDHDFFSINSLLSKGGVMPCRWINLYGQDPQEDTFWNSIKKATGSRKKTYFGTKYLGRVLISMAVSPNEDPETGVSRASPYREPLSKLCNLRVVLFELKNAKNCGDTISLRVSIGPHYVYSKKSRKKEVEDKDTGELSEYFQWGSAYSGEMLSEIKEPFPLDPSQIPDVNLEIISEGTFGEKKVGYKRVSAVELIGNERARWLPFKSFEVHSDIGKYCPGILLACISLGVEGSMPKKVERSKPRKAERFLCYNVYSGLDMAPLVKDSEVFLRLKIYCGSSVITMDDEKASCSSKNRNPIWNWTGCKKLQLHDDLKFENNLRVEVENRFVFIGLKKYWKDVGEFSVPLESCETKWKQPHFFHVMNAAQEGMSHGRVLAEFYISKVPVENQNNPLNRNFETHTCSVEVALIGLRDLIPKYEKPQLTLKIPGYTMGDSKEEAVINIAPEEFGNLTDKSNPNVLKVKTFEKVELPVEPIYLPSVYFHVKDIAFMSANECFTYIPLISYADWIEDEYSKREALELYNKNFTEKDFHEQKPNSLKPLVAQKKKKGDSFTDYDYSEESDDEESELKRLSTPELSGIFEPKNFKVSKRIQFDKVVDDELNEESLMNLKKQELQDQIQSLESESKKIFEKKGEVPEELRNQLKKLSKELEVVEKGKMTVQRFLKVDESLEEDYNFNRPVHKNGVLEDSLMLPYDRYLLFRKSKNTEKLSVYRVGEPTGAILKMGIKIRVLGKSWDEESSSGFDFFHPAFEGSDVLMKAFDNQQYVSRIYLLRGLSLSAVDNAPDLVAFAAGLAAMSSADTYPEILLGSGGKQDGKYICEQNCPVKQNLNPDYYRFYELRPKFPWDWKLEMRIWDFSEYGFDNLIGSTVIDLEDRYFGDPYISNSIMLKTLKEFCEAKADSTEDPEKREWFLKTKKDTKRKLLDLESSSPLSPIEYRPLSHKDKKTSQGMLEMFVEVFDNETAKLVPASKISQPAPEDYELRLIIWNCEGIPKGEREAVDIYFSVQFDPTGWLEEADCKETDTHLGSSDGSGVFNWRMKFNFQIPCTFARLRIVSFDFSTFGDDEALSEVVLDLSKYFRQVQKLGKLSVDEQLVSLSLPNKPNTDGGSVLISFSILSLAEADQRPVGEGQEEPNRDPELEKPQEGRGITDFLKGTAFDVSKWSFNLGLLKKLILLGSIGSVLVVLFIYPGFLAN